jgi:hypothetical protein
VFGFSLSEFWVPAHLTWNIDRFILNLKRGMPCEFTVKLPDGETAYPGETSSLVVCPLRDQPDLRLSDLRDFDGTIDDLYPVRVLTIWSSDNRFVSRFQLRFRQQDFGDISSYLPWLLDSPANRYRRNGDAHPATTV